MNENFEDDQCDLACNICPTFNEATQECRKDEAAFINEWSNDKYRECSNCPEDGTPCEECPEGVKPDMPISRISALFPITREDMDVLTKLQSQLHPCSKLWDALDGILKDMSDKYCELKKERLVK